MEKFYSRQTLFKFGSLLLLTLVLCTMHSCKKSYVDISDGVTDEELQQAKTWYDTAYPLSLSLSSNAKLTAMGSGTTGFDYSQHVKPDWWHPSGYMRFNKKVIEMPIDPSNPILSQLKNKTTGKVYGNKFNSRSSFLITKDGGGTYKAYIMTIIADSAYLNGDLTKLAQNKYNHRDANFSGLVLYFTPKGQYLSGYKYKNGQMVTNTSASAQTNTDSKLRINDLIVPQPPDGCDDWYLAVYDSAADVTYLFYLYTICDEDPITGSGGSPDSPDAPPPPKCPPSDVDPVSYTRINVNSMPLPPSDPDPNNPTDPGFPDPNPPKDPCNPDPIIDTAKKKDTVIISNDPCAKKAQVNARAVNAVVSAQDAAIQSKSDSANKEYGTNNNLATLNGNTYVNTPVTTKNENAADAWTPTVTWDSVNGYTVGFSHGHTDNTAPSPQDVFNLGLVPYTSVLRNQSASDIQFFKNNAQITSTTKTGNYVVTITDWATLATMYSSSFADPDAVKDFNIKYTNYATDYLSDNLHATNGEATAYALMKLFPNLINVYYAPLGSNSYVPLQITNSQNGSNADFDHVSSVICP